MPQHPDTPPRRSAGSIPLFCGLVLIPLSIACGEPEPLTGHRSRIHPEGFADDHAPALRAAAWDPGPCFACHADDDSPGGCRACHEDGPDACEVCHRAPDPTHRAHLDVGCATCHPVPAARGTPGHIEDVPGDVRFSGLARGASHAPRYAEGRCSDTACHARPGAASPAPAWRGQLIGGPCGACHGTPPPDHPADRCDRCHADVVDAAGDLVAGGPHLDGRVQAVDWLDLPCDACHGVGEGAPPPGLDGAEDPSAGGVGAHQAHLHPTAAAPVACATCHLVPDRNDAPGHLDDIPGAEVVFAPAAGPDARYRGGQCADTLCHGPDRPAWTGDAPCGTCHSLPPLDHPVGDCARCHLSAAPGGGFEVPVAHIDGRTDVFDLGPDDCQRCHGIGGRVTLGGSHGAHARYGCTTCHRPVGEGAIAAHLDGDPAIGLPGYIAGRCADDTCHGAGEPVWGVAETVVGCGACHGLPPADHSRGECLDCHPPADDARHADGVVDVTPPDDCTRCHGQPDSGAHRAHAMPLFSAPVACAACHPVPAAVDAPGHFGPPPAEVELLDGIYAEGRCADTGCHAGPGAAHPAPAWDEDGFVCGDCHGVPPPGHLEGACDLCHPAVADGVVIHAFDRHVDGRVDFR